MSETDLPKTAPATDPVPAISKTPEDQKDKVYAALEEELGLKAGKIQEWKDKFKWPQVVHIRSQAIVFRPISRPEWKKLMAGVAELEDMNQADAKSAQEDRVMKMCVLAPDPTKNDVFTRLAGVAGTLAEYIIAASGFIFDDAPVEL